MKKLLCILLCLTMVLSLAACSMGGGEDTDQGTKPTDETQAETVKAEDEIYRDGSAEAGAQKFIKSLLKADYKTALTCFDIPAETPYFTAADVEWYLPRSGYAEILDISYTDYTVYVEKEYANSELAKCKVTINDKNSESKKQFTINMHLSTTNKWGVADSGFYFEEYYLAVPGGKTVVKLNDNIVPESLKCDTFGNEALKDLYKLEYVGKSEKTFTVSSETYDTVTEKIFPQENNAEAPYVIYVYYTEDNAYETVGKLWNGYYSAVMNDLAASELTHTISTTADQKTAEMLLNSMKAMINKAQCSGYQLLNVKACNSKEFKSEYLSSDKVLLHFNYTLSWIDNSNPEAPSSKSMNYHDVILLNLKENKFTIQETLQKNNVFNYKNSEMNEKN